MTISKHLVCGSDLDTEQLVDTIRTEKIPESLYYVCLNHNMPQRKIEIVYGQDLCSKLYQFRESNYEVIGIAKGKMDAIAVLCHIVGKASTDAADRDDPAQMVREIILS